MASNLRELIEQGYAFPALLPDRNDFILSELGKTYQKSGKTAEETDELPKEERLSFLDFGKLESLDGYTLPLIAHDYAAKTPIMWNALYEKAGLNIQNIMLVADPRNIETITGALKSDPKYLGGGFGVGFKEQLNYLDSVIPNDLKAVNIVVREGDKLIGYNTDAQGLVKSIEDKFNEINKELKGSTFILLGAGGVAKETARLLARKNVSKIRILNRTVPKAVSLAYELNEEFEIEALGAGEDIIRGYLLNSFNPPDAVINLTDKGADGRFVQFSAFAEAKGEDFGCNNTTSRTIARELSRLNPEIIVTDIVLPKSGKPRTLAISENEGLKNLIDGRPMVVNQAAPAYVLVQDANPEVHKTKITEEEALEVFKEAANN